MRHRFEPQTNWIYPPIYRLGVTGGATGSTIPVGQTYAASGPITLGCTTTPIIVDLTTLCGPPVKASVPQGNENWSPTPLGHRIAMQADGDNVYVAFGDSLAALGTISPTAVTAVQPGTTGPTGAALNPFTSGGGTAGGGTTTCIKIVKDSPFPFLFELPVGATVNPPGTVVSQDNADYMGGKYSPARYMAFVAGATTVGVCLRIWPASD